MDLPPELRLIIEEYAVDPELEFPKDHVYCDCDPDAGEHSAQYYYDDGNSDDSQYDGEHCDYDGEVFTIYNHPKHRASFHTSMAQRWRMDPAPRMPKILALNRQIRKEALPLFYSNNAFISIYGFNCSARHQKLPAEIISNWVFNIVGQDHMKFIRAIIWYQRQEDNRNYSRVEELSSCISIASLLLLMELCILRCEIRVDLGNTVDHIGCMLQQVVRSLVQTSQLTKADVEGKNAAEVEGLVYPAVKTWFRGYFAARWDGTNMWRNPQSAPPGMTEMRRITRPPCPICPVVEDSTCGRQPMLRANVAETKTLSLGS